MMMRFLEHSGLSRLSALLNDLDVGDRILSGRFELFTSADSDQPESPSRSEIATSLHENSIGQTTMSEINNSNNRQQPQEQGESKEYSNRCDSANENTSQIKTTLPLPKDNALHVLNAPLSSRKRSLRHSSLDLSSPPSKRKRTLSSVELLGTQSPAEARKLLVQLVNTMNACFPDYDFSSITPEAFEHVEDFVSVYTTINYHLSFLVERIVPGFLQDCWSSIKDAINLRNAAVYSYDGSRNGRTESDPYVDNELCLFSFDYFFVDSTCNKILFFTCVTKRKPFGADSLGWPDIERPKSLSLTSVSELDYPSDNDGNDDDENGSVDNDHNNDPEEEDDGEVLYW